MDYISTEDVAYAIEEAGKEHRVVFIDRHMGAGKTTALINSLQQHERYFIVLTYTDEIGRIMKGSEERGIAFDTPTPEVDEERYAYVDEDEDFTPSPRKMDALKRLVKEGRNIVLTHNLLSRVNIDEVDLSAYKLIIDETFECVRPIPSFDMDTFRANYLDAGLATLDEDGTVVPTQEWHDNWYYKDKESVMKGLYHAASSGKLALAGANNGYAVSIVPKKTWMHNKGCVVLTYLAGGSQMVAYLEKNRIAYCIHEAPHADQMFRTLAQQLLKDRVHLIPFQRNKSRSKGKPWSYTQQKNLTRRPADIIKAGKDLKNWMARKLPEDQRCDAEDIIYTCAKDLDTARIKDKKTGRVTSFAAQSSLSKAIWVARNIRATNDFAHTRLVLHLHDINMDPALKAYLEMSDEDEQLWKIGEIIQMVWRSAIREGHPVSVGFASEEMYVLFLDWLWHEIEGVKQAA